MKLTFLGAAHEVTGSCTLLEACGYKILVDCGMEQGKDIYENCDLPLLPGDLDCVLVTHAHIDHTGKIPLLTAGGFDGKIYATGATKKLCNMMLLDSAHIQESEAEWRNRKAKRAGGKPYTPLYTSHDVTKTMERFVACEYGETYSVLQGVTIRFLDAGHLLGSASIEVTVTEQEQTKTIVFSGDVGNVKRPLIRDPQFPKHADYVVIESTYGDRLHGKRADYVSQLTKVLQETFDRGGNVVIPSFAVGRTQELLYLIRHLKEEGRIKGHEGFPVWVDSPMAVEATQIYSKDMEAYFDPETLRLVQQGINPIQMEGLQLSITSDQSKSINMDNTPKVILSASGMCEAGRIRHHLKHNLWRPESTILFVGYQSEGTMGRKLLDGVPSIKLFGEEIQVHAKIEQMDGVSGHADQAILLDWLKNLEEKPECVFVNHGEDTVCDAFAEKITQDLGYPACAPYNGACYNLLRKKWEKQGNRVRIARRTAAAKASSHAFERLLTAGKRLLAVIERHRGASNKELAKFADQVDALAEKWDR